MNEKRSVASIDFILGRGLTKKNAIMKPRRATAMRPPAIPPTMAPVLMAPEVATAVLLALTVDPAAEVAAREAVPKELVCCCSIAPVTMWVEVEV